MRVSPLVVHIAIAVFIAVAAAVVGFGIALLGRTSLRRGFLAAALVAGVIGSVWFFPGLALKLRYAHARGYSGEVRPDVYAFVRHPNNMGEFLDYPAEHGRVGQTVIVTLSCYAAGYGMGTWKLRRRAEASDSSGAGQWARRRVACRSRMPGSPEAVDPAHAFVAWTGSMLTKDAGGKIVRVQSFVGGFPARRDDQCGFAIRDDERIGALWVDALGNVNQEVAAHDGGFARMPVADDSASQRQQLPVR